MDYETIQSWAGLFGLLLFAVLFVGIAWWAYRPRNKKLMEEHGNIPFKEEEHGKKTK